MTRTDIFDAIDTERKYQDTTWGPKFDNANTVRDWVAYIAKYAGNAYTYPVDVEIFRTAMIKTAALAVAAIEAVDRKAPGIQKEVA